MKVKVGQEKTGAKLAQHLWDCADDPGAGWGAGKNPFKLTTTIREGTVKLQWGVPPPIPRRLGRLPSPRSRNAAVKKHACLPSVALRMCDPLGILVWRRASSPAA